MVGKGGIPGGSVIYCIYSAGGGKIPEWGRKSWEKRRISAQNPPGFVFPPGWDEDGG